MRRLKQRVKVEGGLGILHWQRGKPSNWRIADKIKQKVLALLLRRLGADLGQLEVRERHQIDVHPETLRLWLRQARLPYKERKARPHRQWRPRRSCFGEMVQLDESHHDWLEGRGPKVVLMGYVGAFLTGEFEVRRGLPGKPAFWADWATILSIKIGSSPRLQLCSEAFRRARNRLKDRAHQVAAQALSQTMQTTD
jgi:hypothetical protein